MIQSFYPLANSPVLTVEQWSKMAQNWLSTGVIKNALNELQVYADSRGMSVMVKPGQAWVKGHFYESEAEEVLPIASSPPTNPRIDRVILRLDWTTDSMQLAVLQGTPAAIPTAPALTQNSSRWEIPLAQVVVNAFATTIAAEHITDERIFTPGQSYVTAFKTTAISVASGVETKVTFDGENDDNQLEFAGSAFKARKAGILLIIMQSNWASAPTGDTYHYIYRNGSSSKSDVVGAGSKYPNNARSIQVNAGDKLEFYVLQNSGGTAQTMNSFNVQIIQIS